MTVTDVLKLAVQYLGEGDLLQTTLLGGESTPTEQQNQKVNTLFNCVNDTVQVLATMYFPLKKEDILTSSNGIYPFTNFSKPVLDILKVLDSRIKFSVNYAMFAGHFEAKAGTLQVTYTYLPADATSFSQNLEVVENKVTARMVALGAVSRYFLITGMYQDASNWEEMFERAVLVSQRRKDNIVLKKRRWI